MHHPVAKLLQVCGDGSQNVFRLRTCLIPPQFIDCVGNDLKIGLAEWSVPEKTQSVSNPVKVRRTAVQQFLLDNETFPPCDFAECRFASCGVDCSVDV